MFVVHETGVAILLCVLTMIGWGSWANTQKLAGRGEWPFVLFYWDYSIGVALTGLLAAVTLGSLGSTGVAAFANLQSASAQAAMEALLAGGLFNLANILLVAAIDAAGMSIAFPLGIGLALVIGTALSYLETPKGNVALLTSGVIAIIAAMLISAYAHSRVATAHGQSRRAGLWFAIAAGVLMGYFYPELMKSVSPNFTSGTVQPGYLTPYSALLLFGIGVLLSSIPINGVFMRLRRVRFSTYTQAPLAVHWPGILGGAIWMAALTLNVIASGVAGPAISYALGQGATLVAALWGVFVWGEFRDAPPGTKTVIATMLFAYTIGIVLIGRATL